MSQIVYRIHAVAVRLVGHAPVGTNVALVRLLWMLISGRLVGSRGALLAGLDASGLDVAATRRCWAALAYGHWSVEQMLGTWERVVAEDGAFEPHRFGGYSPVACDVTAFYRPRLVGCQTKHFSYQAGKAVPAIPFGLAGPVGLVGEQRLLMPRAIVRADAHRYDDAALRAGLLATVARTLAAEEAAVADRGFPVAQMQAANIERYLVRGCSNFTARRAVPPPYRGRGRRPLRGERVRPLSRQRKGRSIPATPADRTESWIDGVAERVGKQVTVRADFWDDLVLADAPTGAPTFRCIVIHDPRYHEPLLLITPLPLGGRDALSLYMDRWPVEQVPLAAKQMLGAARQFVFGIESRQRLPELSLLAGAVLSYVAATEAAVPTGFWDRTPKPTPGRLRRALAGVEQADLMHWTRLPEQVRKKASRTEHLPKGIDAHRRRKAEHLTGRQATNAT